MAFFLDQEYSQDDLNKKDRICLRTCHCRRNTFRKGMCLCGICECSGCLHIPGDSD